MKEDRTIRGKRHRLCVLLVTEIDERGMPRRLTMVGADERITLQGGERFITAYIPAENFEAQN